MSTTIGITRFGLGPIHISTLIAISRGLHDVPSLRLHVNHKTAGQAFDNMLEGMITRGLIHRGRGTLYYLTAKGVSNLPRGPEFAMTPYVPPARPPRRPNSSVAHVPSMAGGQLVDYRPHC